MAALDRHEKKRADWLLAHEATWHMADRRMANSLKRRAARRARDTSGAAESAHHEGVIRNIGTRFISRGEDSTDKMARRAILLLALPVVVVLVGPALLASVLLYRVSTGLALRAGLLPRAWPWVLLATALGALAWYSVEFSGLASLSVYPVVELDVDTDRSLRAYAAVQAVLGALLTAWQVRRNGWPGVSAQRRVRAPRAPRAPKVPVLPSPAAQEPISLREADDEFGDDRRGDLDAEREQHRTGATLVPQLPVGDYRGTESGEVPTEDTTMHDEQNGS